MTTRKQRHKAYLDQHVKDDNGEYRYVGEWYRLQGGSTRLYPFLGLVLLTGAAVVASGCITAAGLKRIEEFLEEWKEIMSIYQFVSKEGQRHE